MQPTLWTRLVHRPLTRLSQRLSAERPRKPQSGPGLQPVFIGGPGYRPSIDRLDPLKHPVLFAAIEGSGTSRANLQKDATNAVNNYLLATIKISQAREKLSALRFKKIDRKTAIFSILLGGTGGVMSGILFGFSLFSLPLSASVILGGTLGLSLIGGSIIAIRSWRFNHGPKAEQTKIIETNSKHLNPNKERILELSADPAGQKALAVALAKPGRPAEDLNTILALLPESEAKEINNLMIIAKAPEIAPQPIILTANSVGHETKQYYLTAGAKPLGRGGMGEVFEGVDETSGRRVAIKFLTDTDQASASRFEEEYNILKKIGHQIGIVDVYAFGGHEGRPFIVEELIPYPNLAEYAQVRQTLGPEEAAKIIKRVCEILHDLAKNHKVSHRDIKPQNIFYNPETGEVKIADFGLAKDLNAYSDMTRTGVIVGTAAYIAPFYRLYNSKAGRYDGKNRDILIKNDIYALGATLYFLLTGVNPTFQDPQTGRFVRIGGGSSGDVDELDYLQYSQNTMRPEEPQLYALQQTVTTPYEGKQSTIPEPLFNVIKKMLSNKVTETFYGKDFTHFHILKQALDNYISGIPAPRDTSRAAEIAKSLSRTFQLPAESQAVLSQAAGESDQMEALFDKLGQEADRIAEMAEGLMRDEAPLTIRRKSPSDLASSVSKAFKLDEGQAKMLEDALKKNEALHKSIAEVEARYRRAVELIAQKNQALAAERGPEWPSFLKQPTQFEEGLNLILLGDKIPKDEDELALWIDAVNSIGREKPELRAKAKRAMIALNTMQFD